MKKVKYSELANKKVKHAKPVRKLRKGRIVLIVSFIIFVLVDIFLITEFKARGGDALSYKMMQKVSSVLESGAGAISSIWKPELKKDGRFTSVLLVGIDSRHVVFNGEEFINTTPGYTGGERNTDTIMQVVYDHDDGNIFMISIPRDMGVDVEKECLTFHGSIHWVYDKGQLANCPGGGEQVLVETVEKVTGIPVHYYGFVTLEAFVEVIDAVGEVDESGQKGIWLDVPEPVYDIYPITDGGWERVYFPEGNQFLTSEQALRYARVRQNSSDFARARRQQQVIEAVKNRIVSSQTLMNPKKIYSLIKAFQSNTLYTMPNIEEVRAGISIIRDVDTSEIVNIVLDPQLGGQKEYFLNKQPHDRLTAQYYMVPTHWRECPGNEFCRIHEYIQKIVDHPDVYEEQASVFVYANSYNDSWQPDLENSTYQDFKNNGLPLIIQESQFVSQIELEEDIVIFDFTEGEKQATLNALSSKLGAEVRSGQEASSVRLNDEDIAIVVKGN